jgi:hypothetical protein
MSILIPKFLRIVIYKYLKAIEIFQKISKISKEER